MGVGIPWFLRCAPPCKWWFRHSLDPERVGGPALTSVHLVVSFLFPTTIPSGRQALGGVYTALEKPDGKCKPHRVILQVVEVDAFYDMIFLKQNLQMAFPLLKVFCVDSHGPWICPTLRSDSVPCNFRGKELGELPPAVPFTILWPCFPHTHLLCL